METTAKEVLDKHLNILLEGQEEKYFALKEMQAQPEYNSVLNAMEEYAEAKLKNHGGIGDVIVCHCEKPKPVDPWDFSNRLCVKCKGQMPYK